MIMDQKEFRRITSKQFKTILEKKAPVDNVIVAKAFDCEEIKQIGDEDNRTLQFTISTPDVDRDGDTIAIDGWRLTDYEKNPVVLWAHDIRVPPIATSQKTWIEGNKLKSIAAFLPQDLAQHDHVKFADMIFQMYKHKIMRAVSVGFRPIKYAENQERGGWYPIDFLEQELLEYSGVPVPSNPNALEGAKSLGIDVGPMREWAEKILDGDNEGDRVRLWIPRETVESIHKAVTPHVTAASSPFCGDDKVASGGNIPPAREDIPSDDPPDVPVTADVAANNEDKGAISYNRAHPDGTPKADEDEKWSASTEVGKADTEDLTHMCAWYDSSASDKKGSYKLPHHKQDGYALVWNGVKAAMGVLLGARGGVDIPDGDRKGVYNHLKRHYAEFGKDVPEFKELSRSDLDNIEDATASDIMTILMDIQERITKLERAGKSDETAVNPSGDAGLKDGYTIDEIGSLFFDKTADNKNDSVKDDALIFDFTMDDVREVVNETVDNAVMRATGRLP
jgi:hypothetical protein